MSREIASALMADKLNELRKLSYGELAGLVGQTFGSCVTGPDGAEYQMETEAHWDNQKGDNIRVIVAVDGGGVSSFKPLLSSFIIAPDGSFVGEEES